MRQVVDAGVAVLEYYTAHMGDTLVGAGFAPGSDTPTVECSDGSCQPAPNADVPVALLDFLEAVEVRAQWHDIVCARRRCLDDRRRVTEDIALPRVCADSITSQLLAWRGVLDQRARSLHVGRAEGA